MSGPWLAARLSRRVGGVPRSLVFSFLVAGTVPGGGERDRLGQGTEGAGAIAAGGQRQRQQRLSLDTSGTSWAPPAAAAGEDSFAQLRRCAGHRGRPGGSSPPGPGRGRHRVA